MSDRIRKSAATALLASCAAMCLIPATNVAQISEFKFRSANIQEPPLNTIETEVNGPVRVNDANADELTGLYGIGETLAALIVAEREENGPYFYAEDLEDVRGIGRTTLSRFRDMIDLTTEERRK
jgi:competence protein ComEA